MVYVVFIWFILISFKSYNTILQSTQLLCHKQGMWNHLKTVIHTSEKSWYLTYIFSIIGQKTLHFLKTYASCVSTDFTTISYRFYWWKSSFQNQYNCSTWTNILNVGAFLNMTGQIQTYFLWENVWTLHGLQLNVCRLLQIYVFLFKTYWYENFLNYCYIMMKQKVLLIYL